MDATIAAIILSLFASGSFSAEITVNTTADPEGAPGDCSLRDAIKSANNDPDDPPSADSGCTASNDGELDIITFDINDAGCAIPAGDIDTICTIRPLTPLPVITDSLLMSGAITENRVGIPGSVQNPSTNATSRPGIEISGDLSPTGGPGLSFANSNGYIIGGLIINRWRGDANFQAGVGINTENVSAMIIASSYIGVDATGRLASSADVPNYGNLTSGISVNAFSQGSDITIGGINNNTRNIVSNNGNSGISLFHCSNCAILGNFTGTDVTGELALGNDDENLEVRNLFRDAGFASTNNRIEYNLALDSKTRAGIRLLGRGSNPVHNTIVVNNISGVSLLTRTPVPNAQSGLSIVDTVVNSSVGFEVVGDAIVAKSNTFAGNIFNGITVTSGLPPGVPVSNAFLFNNIFGNGSIGNQGDDALSGGDDDDVLYGGQGNDELEGNTGNDLVYGNKGDDTTFWEVGDGSDFADGGDGRDVMDVEGSLGDETYFIESPSTYLARKMGAAAPLMGGEIIVSRAVGAGPDVIIAELDQTERLQIDGSGGINCFSLDPDDLTNTSLELVVLDGFSCDVTP